MYNDFVKFARNDYMDQVSVITQMFEALPDEQKQQFLNVLGITFLIQSQPNKAIVFLPAK